MASSGSPDGHVEIYSEVGQGTTVKMFFPRAASQLEPPERKTLPEPEPLLQGTETILHGGRRRGCPELQLPTRPDTWGSTFWKRAARTKRIGYSRRPPGHPAAVYRCGPARHERARAGRLPRPPSCRMSKSSSPAAMPRPPWPVSACRSAAFSSCLNHSGSAALRMCCVRPWTVHDPEADRRLDSSLTANRFPCPGGPHQRAALSARLGGA